MIRSLFRLHQTRFAAAVAFVLLASVVGASAVSEAATPSAALPSQCLQGQVLSADGSACFVAPPNATPAPPAPNEPAANAKADAGAAEGEAEEEGSCKTEENSANKDSANKDSANKDCGKKAPACPPGFAENSEGTCYEVLDRRHPCIVAGRAPAGVSTNAVLATYTYIPVTGECITQSEFRDRVRNFEASAQAEREALRELQAITDEVIEVEESIAALDDNLHLVRRELLASEVEAKFAEIRREATREELKAVRAKLEVERDRFRNEAVEAYMGGNSAGAVAGALLSSEDVNEFEATIDYASAVLEDQNATVERVEDLEVLTDQLLVDYSAATLVARNAAAQIRLVEAELEVLVEEKLLLLAERESQVLLEAAKIAEIRDDKEIYASALGSESEASTEIQSIIAEAQLYQGTLDGDASMMIPPLDPFRAGSGFGPRLHPILGYVRPHGGIDLSGPSGGLIRATADGVVIIAGAQGGYGNTVVVDHGELLSSLYAHQSSISVSVGDIVKAGDIIGAVGSTGLSTGPHLHFEVRVNGVPVDPLPYLVGERKLPGSPSEEPESSELEAEVDPKAPRPLIVLDDLASESDEFDSRTFQLFADAWADGLEAEELDLEDDQPANGPNLGFIGRTRVETAGN